MNEFHPVMTDLACLKLKWSLLQEAFRTVFPSIQHSIQQKTKTSKTIYKKFVKTMAQPGRTLWQLKIRIAVRKTTIVHHQLYVVTTNATNLVQEKRISRLSRILAIQANCKEYFTQGQNTYNLQLRFSDLANPLVRMLMRTLKKESVFPLQTLLKPAQGLWAKAQQPSWFPCPLKKGSLQSFLPMNYLMSF